MLAAQNLKNTIPSSGWAGIVSLVILVAQNLKNTIPAPPVVGRVEREACFWCL